MRFTAYAAPWIAAALLACNTPAVSTPDAAIDAATEIAPACTDGQSRCGTVCVDLSTSAAHCGACAHACPAGQQCVEGACALGCEAPQSACVVEGAQRCAELRSDEAHCGACGRACGAGQRCEAGACACGEGRVSCGDSCVDTQTNEAHCGACGRACGAGQRCEAGACVCEPGETSCGASCVDLQRDSAHCGACGRACAEGTLCAAGACVAACEGATPDRCGASCVDVRSDRAHCGRCGNRCQPNATCAMGVCAPRNDSPADAIAIAHALGERTTVRGSTVGAQSDDHACSGADHTVFYRLTLSSRSIVYADTFGSGLNTVVGFRTSVEAASSRCSDDACGSTQSQSVIVADAGPLWIEVGSVGATGAFALRITVQPAGSGDVTALENRSGSQVIEGTTEGQRDALAASCADAASGPEDVFYFTTCPSDPARIAHASTCGSSFDTVLEARSVDAPAACDDDGAACGRGSSAALVVPAGAGLHTLVLDGASAMERGAYTLQFALGACAPGFAECGDGCMAYAQMDTVSDCGACGVRCEDGEQCIHGACGPRAAMVFVAERGAVSLTGNVGRSSEPLAVDLCGESQALVGFDYSLDAQNHLSSLQPVCGDLVASGAPTRLAAIARDTLTARGSVRPRRGRAACPNGFVVSGLRGNGVPELHRLALVCSEINVNEGRRRELSVALRDGAVSPIGASGATETAMRCPTNTFAIGTAIRARGAIGAVGLRCARPTAVGATFSPSATYTAESAGFNVDAGPWRVSQCGPDELITGMVFGREGFDGFVTAARVRCSRVIGAQATADGWQFLTEPLPLPSPSPGQSPSQEIEVGCGEGQSLGRIEVTGDSLTIESVRLSCYTLELGRNGAPARRFVENAGMFFASRARTGRSSITECPPNTIVAGLEHQEHRRSFTRWATRCTPARFD